MYTPIDLRVWHLSHVMGWATRKIAAEVHISQASVVRTLRRLDENPPTDDEVQGFMSIVTPSQGLPAIPPTPAQGIPAIPAQPPPPRQRRPVEYAAAVGILLISLAVAGLTGAFAARMFTPPAPVPAATPATSGQLACARYDSTGRVASLGSPRHGNCPYGQVLVIISRQTP